MADLDQLTLRNRLLVAVAMWKEATGEPLPRMPAGDPAEQVREFELTLVDNLCEQATLANVSEMADRTWGLVHDRPDHDPVKRRVIACHERLTALRHDALGRP